MTLTNFAISSSISPHAVLLTEVNLSDISSEFPNQNTWIARFGTVAALTRQFPPGVVPFIIRFLGRTEMALTEYAAAGQELRAFIAAKHEWSLYFRALHHIESSAALLYQAFDISRKKIGFQLFKTGDGSSIERLNSIYNISKHEALTTHEPVWITNNAIHTHTSALTFLEFEMMLRECATISEELFSIKVNLSALASNAQIQQ